MKANEIITVLNQFKDSSYYQKVLINGTWGIGKTKYVSDFKEGHPNTCYVSLFGRKDIDSIIQEIYFQIIENVPNGNIKKTSRVIREKLNNVSFRLPLVSISVPLIGNLHTTLYEELGNKDTFIIIFDDLERKHTSLDLKEIFGLIDSLAKLNNIKTVLIASTDQLKDVDKETFINYQEKAVDRTYTIDEYADAAPVKILGEQIWGVIGKPANNLKFNNLRTFEKTNQFIKEVFDILGEDVFTDKFTKADVYRMCFATVFFKIEHKCEMKLLDTKKENSDIMNAFYTNDESGVIEYLYNIILKNSLDNVMSKNVFHHIKNWYETGAYSREIIINIIASINSYEEKPRNFYSSEQEILNIIEHVRKYIKNLNGTERMEDIISRISAAFEWCEVLSVDFGISNEEIVDLVSKNNSNRIDIAKSSYQNEISLLDFHVESKEARKVINSINEALNVEYYDQLIKRINDCFIQQSFNKYLYLKQLTDSIISTKDKAIIDNVIKSISDNKFFFPIPSGKITEDHWNWCHQIINLIANINQHWAIENYYDDFKDYIYSLEITKENKMLQHRLKKLFGNNK
ncbi:hypothetical protein [Peribacillus butanolivorans]|uniref:hypothetical protein n=1 Tax=Peribacillus butanolivorans TaxID=421767 RepID=UPI0037F2D86D